MSAILSREQTRGARPVFLLTLTWGGREYLFSTEPVVVVKDDGTELPFRGGLNDPDYAESFDRVTVSTEGQGAPFEVVFPEDIAARIRAGYPLHLAGGELSMVLVRGRESLQLWEDRFEVLVGDVVQPQWGDPRKPTGWAAFSLEERPFDDRSPILSPSWRITARTWLNHDTAHTGKAYPLVFGSPGYYQDEAGIWQVSQGSPAYYVKNTFSADNPRKLLIAVGEVEADTVTIFDEDAGGSTTFGVLQEEDGLGQMCALTEIDTVFDPMDPLTTLVTFGSSEYWTGWHAGGALVSPFRAGVLERADDLVRYLGTRSRLRLDHGAWEAAGRLFRQLRFGGYVNDPEAQVWPWLREQILPLLPLVARRTARGLAPIPLLPTCPVQKLPHIEAGLDFALASAERETKPLSDVVNDLSLGIAPSKGEGGQSQLWRRISGDYTAEGRVPDQAAEISKNLYGPRLGDTRATSFIHTAATADRALHWMIRRAGFIPTEATFLAHARFGWLSVGQDFALTCDGLTVRQRRALVLGKSWSGPMQRWVYELEISPDPLEHLLESAG